MPTPLEDVTSQFSNIWVPGSVNLGSVYGIDCELDGGLFCDGYMFTDCRFRSANYSEGPPASVSSDPITDRDNWIEAPNFIFPYMVEPFMSSIVTPTSQLSRLSRPAWMDLYINNCTFVNCTFDFAMLRLMDGNDNVFRNCKVYAGHKGQLAFKFHGKRNSIRYCEIYGGCEESTGTEYGPGNQFYVNIESINQSANTITCAPTIVTGYTVYDDSIETGYWSFNFDLYTQQPSGSAWVLDPGTPMYPKTYPPTIVEASGQLVGYTIRVMGGRANGHYYHVVAHDGHTLTLDAGYPNMNQDSYPHSDLSVPKPPLSYLLDPDTVLMLCADNVADNDFSYNKVYSNSVVCSDVREGPYTGNHVGFSNAGGMGTRCWYNEFVRSADGGYYEGCDDNLFSRAKLPNPAPCVGTGSLTGSTGIHDWAGAGLTDYPSTRSSYKGNTIRGFRNAVYIMTSDATPWEEGASYALREQEIIDNGWTTNSQITNNSLWDSGPSDPYHIGASYNLAFNAHVEVVDNVFTDMPEAGLWCGAIDVLDVTWHNNVFRKSGSADKLITPSVNYDTGFMDHIIYIEDANGNHVPRFPVVAPWGGKSATTFNSASDASIVAAVGGKGSAFARRAYPVSSSVIDIYSWNGVGTVSVLSSMVGQTWKAIGRGVVAAGVGSASVSYALSSSAISQLFGIGYTDGHGEAYVDVALLDSHIQQLTGIGVQTGLGTLEHISTTLSVDTLTGEGILSSRLRASDGRVLVIRNSMGNAVKF